MSFMPGRLARRPSRRAPGSRPERRRRRPRGRHRASRAADHAPGRSSYQLEQAAGSVADSDHAHVRCGARRDERYGARISRSHRSHRRQDRLGQAAQRLHRNIRRRRGAQGGAHGSARRRERRGEAPIPGVRREAVLPAEDAARRVDAAHRAAWREGDASAQGHLRSHRVRPRRGAARNTHVRHPRGAAGHEPGGHRRLAEGREFRRLRVARHERRLHDAPASSRRSSTTRKTA